LTRVLKVDNIFDGHYINGDIVYLLS